MSAFRSNLRAKFIDNVFRFPKRVDFTGRVNFTEHSDVSFDNLVTFTGTSTSSVLGDHTVHRTHYINAETDLDPNGDNTKWLLEASSTYVFEPTSGAPFILTRGFEIPNTPAEFVGIRIHGRVIIYFGAGAMFDETDLQSQFFLQITNVVILGGAVPFDGAARQLFNLVGTGPVPPVCLINDCQLSNFDGGLGMLQAFDAVVLNSTSLRANGGPLEIVDYLNLMSSSLLNLQFDDDSVGFNYIEVSGTTNIETSIQLSATNYIPTGVNAHAIFIAANLTPNISISGCTFDNRNIADKSLETFFEPTGLDQTSIYTACISNKNIVQARIQGTLSARAGNTTTTINTVNQFYTLALPSGAAVSNEERISSTLTNGRMLYFGLERTQFQAIGQVNLEVASSTSNYEIRFFLVQPGVATTADNTTNTFTSTAHGLVDTDYVTFDATTHPAGVVDLAFYRVVNSTANTFQIEETVGLGVHPFTTNGTGVTWRKSIQQPNVSRAEIKSTAGVQVVLISLVTNVLTNYSTVLTVRNITDTRDVICSAYDTTVSE